MTSVRLFYTWTPFLTGIRILFCFCYDASEESLAFKQTVKQNNKITSLEKIQYNSKNTKFQEKFTTKDILSATSMPQPTHREAAGHRQLLVIFPLHLSSLGTVGWQLVKGWSQGWISDLLLKTSYIPLYHKDRYQI